MTADTHLYLDRQSETAWRTYRVYVTGADGSLLYAGKVIQPDHGGSWYAGQADRHPRGHTSRAAAVRCLLRRVTQLRLEAAS